MAHSPVPFSFDLGDPAARSGDDPFALLHREVNRLFDDVLHGHRLAVHAGATTAAPHLEVFETAQEIGIEAELPGVPEQNVQVELTDDLLTIRGERRAAHDPIGERVLGFARTVRLPFAPPPDEVRATFANGVLRITLPKSTLQARMHRIPVLSATAAGMAPDDEAEGCLGTAAATAGHPTPRTTQDETGEATGCLGTEAAAAGHPTPSTTATGEDTAATQRT